MAHPVLLSFAFTFFHQELLGTRDEGRVKVRPSPCSNTLDYRRGRHPSTPDCSQVGHVSAGTRQTKKERKKSIVMKKLACTRSTFDTSCSSDSNSMECQLTQKTAILTWIMNRVCMPGSMHLEVADIIALRKVFPTSLNMEVYSKCTLKMRTHF